MTKHSKLSVAHIIDTLNPGGAESVLITMCNLLHQYGYLVTVITILKRGILSNRLSKGIQLVEIRRRNRLDFRAALKLRSMLKDQDLVHVHMRHVFRYFQVVAIIFRLNKPVVFHDHYGKIKIDKSVPLFFATLFKPNYYIGVSKDLTNWAENSLKVAKRNILFLPNIVIIKYYSPTSKFSGIVLVSNIKPVKNQLFAIQLIKRLDENLTIYGHIMDIEYYNKLVSEIDKSGLNERVRIISDHNNPIKELSKYKLGIHTSVSETGPITILEYISQKLPFVAFRSGQVAENLCVELEDLFLDSFNIDLWISKIKMVAANNSIRKRLEKVKESNEPERYIDLCNSFYKKMLNHIKK